MQRRHHKKWRGVADRWRRSRKERAIRTEHTSTDNPIYHDTIKPLRRARAANPIFILRSPRSRFKFTAASRCQIGRVHWQIANLHLPAVNKQRRSLYLRSSGHGIDTISNSEIFDGNVRCGRRLHAIKLILVVDERWFAAGGSEPCCLRAMDVGRAHL